MALWAVYTLGIAGILCCAALAVIVVHAVFAKPRTSEYQRQQFRKAHERVYWSAWNADAAARFRASGYDR